MNPFSVASIAGLGDVYFDTCEYRSGTYPTIFCQDAGFSSWANPSDPTNFISDDVKLHENPFWAAIVEKYFELIKILIRSELCNHEYVLFTNKKMKYEIQSFGYFTPFQQDKFMKKLGEHFYTIIS